MVMMMMTTTTKKLSQIDGGEVAGGVRIGGGGPAPFLTKTHQMVEDACNDDVISWGEKGRSFVVWKPVEFARDLLPANFKHNNFSSFVRQLNTYGFRKLVPDRWEFSHDNFRRGEQSLLHEIRRRKAPPPPPAASKSNAPPPPPSSASNSGEVSSTSSPPPSPPSLNLRSLSNENGKLKKDNEILTEELARTKRQYEELRCLLSKYEDVNELNPVAAESVQERKDSKCFKLFGVLLTNDYEREEETSKIKRRRCEGGGAAVGVTIAGG